MTTIRDATPLDIAVVIPCADDMRLLNCLNSIDENVEILIALNGATKAVYQLVQEKRLRYCELPDRNLGAACDVGVKAAHASSVLLMNSDCIFAPGTIRKLYEALSSSKVARGRVIFEVDDFLSRVVADARDFAYAHPDKAYQPALAFRKDVADSIGGYYFDGDIHWTEDADFSRRLKSAGIPVAYVSSAIVHHSPLSLKGDLRSAMRYGMGRRIAEEKRLVGTRPPYRPYPWRILALFQKITQAKGLFAAAYTCGPWTFAFSMGYLRQKWGMGYNFDTPSVHDGHLSEFP